MAKKKKKAKKTNRQPVAKEQNTATKKDINQLDTPSFRVFSGLIGLAFLAGLLAGNDTTTIWAGAEASNLWNAIGDQPSNLLTQFLHAVYDDGPLNVFYLRFFGVFFFLFALLGSFFLGRKLFGKNTTSLALLLLATSLLLPNLAKRASADIYLFSSQLLFGMSTLYLLKAPAAGWRLLWLLSLYLSFLFEPLGSLLFALPFILLLWRSHPQGKCFLEWQTWLPAVIGLGVLLILQSSPWLEVGISFAWLRSNYLHYLGWQVLAILPFIGFVVGGIRDLLYKLKRKEEFSILLTAWILAALLSQSLTLSWALAILAAKQMQLYFDPKYPFLSWVRGAAVLQLVLAFFVLAVGMVLAFWEFKGLGFRSLLSVSGVYWMMGLLGVIGLYGFNHRLLIGGPILSGALAIALFWMQFGPLLESRRSWSAEAVEMAKQQQTEDNPQSLLLFYPNTNIGFPASAVYGLDRMRQVKLISTEEALQAAVNESGGILILEQSTTKSLDIPLSADTLSGWNDRLERVQYQVVVPR